MAYKKPPEPPKPVLPPDNRKAQGLNNSAMSANIISGLAAVSVSDFLEKDADGNEFMSKANAKKMSKKAHQALCDAINEEVKKNCYVLGDYAGLLTAGSPPPPDLNGPYTFEVMECNLTSDDVFFYSTEHSDALISFQSKLGLALTQKIKFKTEDTRSYLTVPPLTILPGTLFVIIPNNTTGANVDQQTMMDRIVKAVIDGIEGAKVMQAAPATSKGPGTGTWTFSQII